MSSAVTRSSTGREELLRQRIQKLVPSKTWLAVSLLAKNLPTAQALNFEFPQSKDEIQLDLVGLLTVIGEAAMAIHAQTITVSHFSLLPRILPAPQAFLLPIRPIRLPPNDNILTVGVFSGNVRRHLNYIPSLLHEQLDNNAPFSIEVVTVERVSENEIHAALISPLTALSSLGVVVGLGLLGLAIQQADPMALIALPLLYITSSLTGLGSKWNVMLQKRKVDAEVPPADVILKSGPGAFMLIKCTEEVARELYFGQEICQYKLSEKWFRVCAGLGTFTLMAAVVALANCNWWMQASIGLSYIIMNALYWFVAVLPHRWGWNLKMFKVETVAIHHGHNYTYTVALDKLVKLTKTTAWGRGTDLVPNTLVWMRWLDEAEQNLEDGKWDGQARWKELFQASKHLPVLSA